MSAKRGWGFLGRKRGDCESGFRAWMARGGAERRAGGRTLPVAQMSHDLPFEAQMLPDEISRLVTIRCNSTTGYRTTAFDKHGKMVTSAWSAEWLDGIKKIVADIEEARDPNSKLAALLKLG